MDARVGEIIAGMRGGTISDDAAIPALNVALKSASQFEWIGTFTSLRNGKGELASSVVRSFRGGDTASPIASYELNDFREYLESYGL